MRRTLRVALAVASILLPHLATAQDAPSAPSSRSTPRQTAPARTPTAPAVPAPATSTARPRPLEIGPLTQGALFTRLMVGIDISNFLRGSPHLFAYPEHRAWEASKSVSADTLARAYRDNEIAAEGQYGGRVLQISGPLNRVRRNSFTGVPYAELGTQMFNTVAADISALPREEAAAMQPGQNIRLICRSAKREIGDVHVNGCASYTTLFGEMTEKANRQISDWLSGGRQPGFTTDGRESRLWMLFLVYWVGTEAPANSPCLAMDAPRGPNLVECANLINRWTGKDMKDEGSFVSAYAQAQERLGLPSWP